MKALREGLMYNNNADARAFPVCLPMKIYESTQYKPQKMNRYSGIFQFIYCLVLCKIVSASPSVSERYLAQSTVATHSM